MRSRQDVTTAARVELLEDRTLLSAEDIISVGRFLSAWHADDVQNDTLIVTYSVFNQQSRAVSDISLVTTFQPGITVNDSSVPAGQDGNEFTWTFSSIEPFQFASVDVTISRDDAGVLQIDGGAAATGVSDGTNVSDVARPAALRAGSADQTLLSSTDEADTADPFLRAEAAKYDQDANQLFGFVRDDISFESYAGSLRGARGALWSGAGNALDQSSLLVGLLRTSGVPARYDSGDLAEADAQQLIASMFDEPNRVVGYLEPDALLSDPVNDESLIAETTSHYWVEFDAGSGFQDADPSFGDTAIGESMTTSEGTFSTVPADLQHTLTVRLDREFAIPASGLLGGSALDSQTVLEETFSTAEVVGRPLSIGHFVSRRVLASVQSVITNTFSPFLVIGENDADLGDDELLRGEDYQEIITGFPLSNKILTGLTLEVDTVQPGGETQTFSRTLLDRLGFEIRTHGGSPDLQIDENTPPPISEVDVVTINALPGLQNPATLAVQRARLQTAQTQLAALQPAIDEIPESGPLNTEQVQTLSQASRYMQQIVITTNETKGIAFAATADTALAQLEDVYLTKAYYDSPRLILSQTTAADGELEVMLDLRKNDVRTIAAPGQMVNVTLFFEMMRGMMESTIEGDIVSNVTDQEAVSIDEIFEATGPHNPLVFLTIDNIRELNALTIPEQARLRIADALAAGRAVITPSAPVTIDGTEYTGWLETDLETGETISVFEDGSHFGIAAYTAALSLATNGPLNLTVSAFIGTINGMALTSMQFTGELIAGLASGLSLESAVTFAKARVTTTLVKEFIDQMQSAGTSLGLEALLGDNIVSKGLKCVASLTKPYSPPPPGQPETDTGLLRIGVCLWDEIKGALNVSGLEAAFKGGLVLGMAMGVQQIAYNFPGDPPVFPWLSTPLRDPVPPIAPGTNAGVSTQLVREELFYYPYNGAQLESVYTVQIQNTGPVEDRFDLQVTGLPAGFEALLSLDNVNVPAGHTAEVGVTIRPTGGPLPPPGTSIAFTVTSTSQTDGSVSDAINGAFELGEIHAVQFTSVTSRPVAAPGDVVTVDLTVTATGNVTADVVLSFESAGELTFDPVPGGTLSPQQSLSRTITIAVDPGASLDTVLAGALTAVFGSHTETLPVPVEIRAPGVAAIGTAAHAAQELERLDLANQLEDLRDAVNTLVANPGDAVAKSEVGGSLASIVSIMQADDVFVNFTEPFTAAQADFASATTDAECRAAIDTLAAALADFAALSRALVGGNFEVFLIPSGLVAQPLVPRNFDFRVRNVGTETTTYDLSLGSLPSEVTGTIDVNQVTLAPGETAVVGATLTQTTDDERLAFNFTVDAAIAGLPTTVKSATGTLRARNEFVAVTDVRVSPAFGDAGEQFAVEIDLLNVVNREQSGELTYLVFGETGLVFDSGPIPVTLTTETSLLTVDGGLIDSTGFADGQYTVDVFVLSDEGLQIPGALGRGTLLVGSPVNGSIATTPDVLPPGDHTVTTSLQISAIDDGASNDLTLIGHVPLDDFGAEVLSGIEVHGNVVYAFSEAGVHVTDVTDPANPTFLRTIGGAETWNGTIDPINNRLIAVDNGVVGIPILSNSSLSVYDLAGSGTPETPVRRSTRFTNYTQYLTPLMSADGTHAFVTVFQLLFTPFGEGEQGDFFTQNASLHSFDLTNSASPQLVDILMDDNGNNATPPFRQNGGNFSILGTTAVDDSTLYLGSSTSTGDDVTTDINGDPAVGRIMIVDISDPTDLSFVGDTDPHTNGLLIPGTMLIDSVAVDGNTALVVGSQGTWQEPFDDVAFIGPTGNLVLTTLDISDPLNPSIIASITLDRAARGGGDVKSLGNGLFAFDSAGEAGDTPQLYVVDASDPTDIRVQQQIAIADDIFNLDYDGQFLYGTGAGGLSIYSFGGTNTSTFVFTQVPTDTGVAVVDGSFSIAPTDIISDNGFDTLFWDMSLIGTSSRTITWQSTIQDLQPGESRDVTLSTNINFDSDGTTGIVRLGGTDAIAGQVLLLNPGTQTAQPGDARDFVLTIANPGQAEVTYDLSVTGVPDEWVGLPAQITVGAESQLETVLTLTQDPFAAETDYGFVVTATVDGTSGSVEGLLRLVGDPILPDVQRQSHGVVIEILSTPPALGPDTTGTIAVRLINTGSREEAFDVALQLPPGLTAPNQPPTTIPPGRGNYRDIVLTVVSDGIAPIGTSEYFVTATSTTNPEVSATETGSLDIVGNGVTVALTPAAASVPTAFDMTIVNSGISTDTFDLSVDGPAAPFAALSQPSVTLDSGQSATVTITVSEVFDAHPGTLRLVAGAVSQGHSEIRAADSADVEIAQITGLDVIVTPAVRELELPGDAVFVVEITNTGNVEDAYMVEIVAISGSVVAALRDSDGSAVQTVPLAVAPGLSTVGIPLDVTLTQFGTGEVTVRVTSINDGNLMEEVTAVLETPETAATVSINDVAKTEGLFGVRHFVFTATRSTGEGAATVRFRTVDRTATVSDHDYIAKSGTIEFADGETERTISVRVKGDLSIEANETFEVRLSDPSGVTIDDGVGIGTIVNDDMETCSWNDGSGIRLRHGNLIVVGSNGHDEIVTTRDTGRLLIDVNGTVHEFAVGDVLTLTVCGMKGHDTLEVTTPLDIVPELNGGNGRDTLRGNSGAERLIGGDDRDWLYGHDGNDTIFGGDDNDTVIGGAGNDLLRGGGERDLLKGGLGNDRIFGGNDRDSMYGGGGSDLLHGWFGSDYLNGGGDDDTMFGGRGGDRMIGGEGHDLIFGQGERDHISAGRGNDTVQAGSGRDVIEGNDGDDFLMGSDGNDFLDGGDGHDILHGGRHNDDLRGRLGNDILIGHTGRDALRGGGDEDILIAGWTKLSDHKLNLIRSEWTSPRSYATRVANIRDGSGSADRSNANAFLKATSAATVCDDQHQDRDTLWGDAATDWFFAAPSDRLQDHELFEDLDIL